MKAELIGKPSTTFRAILKVVLGKFGTTTFQPRVVLGRKNNPDVSVGTSTKASRKNGKGGFSTLEILIAFAVLIISTTAVILVIFGNQSVAVDTQTNTEALSYAQAVLEDARALSRQNFGLVASKPVLNIQSGPIAYAEKLDVTDINAFTKQATSTVTWPNGARTLKITLATLLTNPTSALGGDTCNQTLSGDWTNPQLLGSADVGQNNGGTDVDVINKKAYVTTNASVGNKPDFYIMDVTNPNLPNLPILGSVETGPGLAAVHVAGQHAYVANISTLSQLQAIDISVPGFPSVVKSFRVTAAGDTAVGNSIFYANKKIYLGLTKSTGAEFYVIDVSTPLTPILKASIEINSQVSAITVKNNIAYLAVPDDTATPGTSEQLKVLDVSQADAGIISLLTPFSPNPSTMSGKSVHISKDGNTLYLGQGGANPGHRPEFFVLDVSTPYSISQINSKYIPTSNNVTVDAITVRSNLAFLWTSDTNLNFQIWDLNNLGNPAPYGSLNTAQSATGGFDCDGNIIYTAQKSNKALQIIGPLTVN